MIWLEFIGSSLLIVFAATRLAGYGDAISIRTRMGGLFVGTLLMAGATSLPELLTSINAINQGVPNLTVGNIFGSCMFNMFLLAMIDLLYRRLHILRRLAITHALSGGLALLLIGLSVFFILAQVDITVGWVGLDSIVLIALYLFGTRILFGGNRESGAGDPPAPEDFEGVPTLRRAGIGFVLAALALVAITPLLVSSSTGIAEATGLSTGFVGIALVGIITSLPEVVTTVQASRIGAYDLAAGNLFGSNIFNIFTLGLTDLFYVDGRFLAEVSDIMSIAGMLALIVTNLALLGNLVRHLAWGETRRQIVELDAALIVVVYLLGMWLLYSRGLIG
ncbi:sodium:calcium antiporter [Aggregatilinea lenta]|uniref:sodium:calcium antiporter n=1 Tax=Aggregatilinea lenta TaxID=913108 RepID=UPI000E5B3020|nr:sodium:calcium antiporter [Aggregatilinea lenta]